MCHRGGYGKLLSLEAVTRSDIIISAPPLLLLWWCPKGMHSAGAGQYWEGGGKEGDTKAGGTETGSQTQL